MDNADSEEEAGDTDDTDYDDNHKVTMLLVIITMLLVWQLLCLC